MIDDESGITAATAKSHKQVIWDLEALSCFSIAEDQCFEMLQTKPKSCTYHPTWAQIVAVLIQLTI